MTLPIDYRPPYEGNLKRHLLFDFNGPIDQLEHLFLISIPNSGPTLQENLQNWVISNIPKENWNPLANRTNEEIANLFDIAFKNSIKNRADSLLKSRTIEWSLLDKYEFLSQGGIGADMIEECKQATYKKILQDPIRNLKLPLRERETPLTILEKEISLLTEWKESPSPVLELETEDDAQRLHQTLAKAQDFIRS